MADTKISALSAASALDGTEVYPGVQSAASVKVTGAQIKTMVRRAGTATAGSWPILGSGTVLTSPVAGAEEFDGSAHYFTPAASSRAVDLCEWVAFTPAANYALGNNANPQKIFNIATNGALTIPTGLFFFDGLISVLSMDTVNSTNAKIDILGAGTATTGSWLWHTFGIDNTPGNNNQPTGQTAVTSASLASVVTGATNSAVIAALRGTFRCTGTGTLIPSITLSTAAAASVRGGSYLRLRLMGGSSVTTCGNWA